MSANIKRSTIPKGLSPGRLLELCKHAATCAVLHLMLRVECHRGLDFMNSLAYYKIQFAEAEARISITLRENATLIAECERLRVSMSDIKKTLCDKLDKEKESASRARRRAESNAREALQALQDIMATESNGSVLNERTNCGGMPLTPATPAPSLFALGKENHSPLQGRQLVPAKKVNNEAWSNPLTALP